MIAVLFLIFAFVFSVALIEDHIVRVRSYIYWGIAVVLMCYAGFREIGFDLDSVNYEYSFKHYEEDSIMKEVSFTFLSWFIQFFSDDVRLLFIVYAVLGVGLKMKAFRRLMPNEWFVPVLIYISYYFVLQEMTQIRAGVAAGFFLLSIRPLSEGRKGHAALWMLLALLFHYSAIALFPLLLFGNKPLSRKWLWLLWLSVPCAFLMYFAHIEVTSMPLISDKMSVYQRMVDHGLMNRANVFNVNFLLRICIFYFILIMHKTVSHFFPYLPIMLKCMAISMILFVFFSPVSVLAFRFMELFGSVDIILFSCIFYCFRQSMIGKTVVGMVGMALMSLNIFYLELLQS